MITIRLGAADRKTLDAPEQMSIDLTRFRVAEVRALKQQTGHTVDSLSTALQSQDVEAVVALVWLALHRHGIEINYDELDFDLADIDLEVESEGKVRTASTGN